MTGTDCWRKESPKSDIEPFNIEELESAARNIKCVKAPGPDNVSSEAAKASPVWLLKILNKILETQTFPEEWKIAKKRKVRMKERAKKGDDKTVEEGVGKKRNRKEKKIENKEKRNIKENETENEKITRHDKIDKERDDKRHNGKPEENRK
ncbi:hypothetical protein QE152_g19048 [Popillia japonica]|uniref:Uncharacterized protein n=1 Tax=Popillia japonica TaxID=7064 RepID=A0AAW1L412_POPJA